MTNDPTPSPHDRRLDEMTAALRDAGATEADALPPEVRRATLQALWVADAGRYEGRSARHAKLVRALTVLVAAALLIAAGGVVVHLTTRAWERRDDPARQNPYVRRTQTPIPATLPVATQPAVAQGEDPGAPPAAPPAVTGKVVFLGTPPPRRAIDLSAVPHCRAAHPTLLDESLIVGDAGGLANVVVSLRRADGYPLTAPSPSEAALLDQRGCQFVPHVLVVRVGQTLVVKNSDPFLHNVRSISLQNPAFNFGQPNVDPGTPLPAMQAPERFRIKCDLHPWMTAYVNVFDHPYHAVTGSDGAFSIPETPPDGTYTVTAWHESLGEKQATVVVQAGKIATADFVFDGTSLQSD
jgi:hypothetical protein